jgi:hypothetical protein
MGTYLDRLSSVGWSTFSARFNESLVAIALAHVVPVTITRQPSNAYNSKTDVRRRVGGSVCLIDVGSHTVARTRRSDTTTIT